MTAATVFRQGHIGRLSSYALMAVEAGMIGLITADSGRSPKNVASTDASSGGGTPPGAEVRPGSATAPA